MDFSKLAKQFLKIKSVSEEGNEEVINFLIPIFEQLGAKLVMQQVPHSIASQSKRQFNLLAIFGDELVDSRTRKGLLLTAPVDTASPGAAESWVESEKNPYSATEKNGFLYGPGAVNSKLNFLAMVQAASAFHEKRFPQPLYLAATCGGESMLAGSKYFIQSGAVNPKYAIVGRPSKLRLQNVEKSQLTFLIRISYVAVEKDAQDFNAKAFVTAKAKSKHVFHAEAEKNALEGVIRFLETLQASPVESKLITLQGRASLNQVPESAVLGLVVRSKDLDAVRSFYRTFTAANRDVQYDLRFGGTGERGIKILPQDIYKAFQMICQELVDINQAMAPMRDEKFSPAHPKAVLTAINQERDALELTVQFSLLPELASVESRKEIEQDFKHRISRVASHFQSISSECRRMVSTPRFFSDPNTPFVRSLKADLERIGVASELIVGNSATEAGYFSEKGYDTIVFGAGDHVAESNCSDEKISLQDLATATQFYERAIEAFCIRAI